MKKTLVFAALLALLVALPGLAQEEQETERKTEGTAAQKGDVKRILELPKRTQEAREAGIPEEDVQQVLEVAKQHKLSPEETGELMTESAKAARENGQVENFGDFVKTKMGEGLRGKDLASAIHEEHKARGKGHKGQAKGGAKGEAKGKTRQEMEKHKGKAEDGQGHGDAKQHQEKTKQMQGEGDGQQKKQEGDQTKGDAKGDAKGKQGDKGGQKGKGGSR